MRFKGKRGVSIIIGYILLVAVVMTISIIVYQWLKTYVPSNSLSCPDGISISVINYSYTGCTTDGILNLTITNTGTFGIYGYYIHGSSSTGQLATVDLSPAYIGSNPGGGGTISYGGKYACGTGVSSTSNKITNCLNPGQTSYAPENGFNVSKLVSSASLSSPGSLKEITILPVWYEVYNNQPATASCTSAAITIPVSCS